MSIVKDSIMIFWITISLPLVVLGCACGWFYGAFIEGCDIGYKDWNDT